MEHLGLHAYMESQKIAAQDPPFCALIAAAARKADTENMAKLEAMWPQTVADLRKRYNAPGGRLENER